MEYIIIYLVTILASFGVEVVGELSFIKEVAQKGYKLDMKKATEHISKKERKMNIFKKFIPVYNIIHSFKQLSDYEKQKNKILRNPEQAKSLVEMNEIERSLFEDKPSSITALNLAVTDIDEKNYRMPKGFISISNGTYRNENNDGTYTQIKFRKETDRIVVTSLEGEILKLDPKEQQKELNRIFRTLYKLNAVIEEPSQITLQKEALIAHRDEILAQQDEIKLSLK